MPCLICKKAIKIMDSEEYLNCKNCKRYIKVSCVLRRQINPDEDKQSFTCFACQMKEKVDESLVAQGSMEPN